MARGNVRVSITADTSGLKRGVDSAERDLKKLGRSANGATGGFRNLGTNATKSLGGISKSSDVLHGKLGKGGLTSAVSDLTSTFSKGTVAAAGVGAAIAALAPIIDQAVDKTVDLGTATLKLQPFWKEGAEDTSAFAEVLSTYGISAGTAQKALIKLNAAIAGGQKGVKGSVADFKTFGLSMEQVKRSSPHDILVKVADGMKKNGISAKESAAAQHIFGRGYAAMLPILKGGGAAFDANIKKAKEYGAYLSSHGLKGVKDYKAAMREQKMAQDALSIAIGTKVIPVLLKGIQVFTQMMRGIRTGKGEFGSLKKIVAGIGEVFKAVWNFAKNFVGGIVQAIKGFVGVFKNAFGLFKALINGDFKGAWKSIKGIVKSALSGLGGVFKALLAPVWSYLKSLPGKALNAVGDLAGAVVGEIKKIPGKVLHVGADIFNSIIDGIGNAAKSAGQFSHKIGRAIADWLNRNTPLGDNVNVGPVSFKLPSLRGGGEIGGIGRGAVPAMVSPGEQVLYGNSSWIVPGQRVAADNVFTMLPTGAAVLTDDGQARMAAGQSLGRALASQAPHFGGGGRAYPKATTHRGPASWYGGPNDKGDLNPITAFGYSHSHPGISLREALFNSALWGPASKRHAFYRVVAPNKRVAVLPLIDKGPGSGGTGSRGQRLIDIGTGALHMFGYTEGNFPTDSIWRWTGPYYSRGDVGGKGGRGGAGGGKTLVSPGYWKQPATTHPAYSRSWRGLYSTMDERTGGASHNRTVGTAVSRAISGLGLSGSQRRRWIKAVYGTAKMPGGGGHPSGGGKGGSYHGLVQMDGRPTPAWIAHILGWAKAHGWHGTVGSGYRTAAQQESAANSYGRQHYPNGVQASNHRSIDYPGGAVDVSSPDQLASVLRGYHGKPNLVWGWPVMGDRPHFSASGHRRGGLLFARRGLTGHKVGRTTVAQPRQGGSIRGLPHLGGGLSSTDKTFVQMAGYQLGRLWSAPDSKAGKAEAAGVLKVLGQVVKGASASALLGIHSLVENYRKRLYAGGIRGQREQVLLNRFGSGKGGGALGLVSAALGARLADPIKEADDLETRLGYEEGRLDTNLWVRGIDPDSPQGRAEKARWKMGAIAYLQASEGKLARYQQFASKHGFKDAARRLGAELGPGDGSVRDMIADIQAGIASEKAQGGSGASGGTSDEVAGLLTEIRDNQQRVLNVQQVTPQSLAQVLTEIVSGEIGGRIGLGYQTPSFAGRGGLARY